MAVKLFDSELKVMEILWENGDTTAKQLAEILGEKTGWNKTTTYTVIKRCIEKAVIERREPKFICRPLVTMEDARIFETAELIDKMYDGAADKLVASMLEGNFLSEEELKRLKQFVRELK